MANLCRLVLAWLFLALTNGNGEKDTLSPVSKSLLALIELLWLAECPHCKKEQAMWKKCIPLGTDDGSIPGLSSAITDRPVLFLSCCGARMTMTYPSAFSLFLTLFTEEPDLPHSVRVPYSLLVLEFAMQLVLIQLEMGASACSMALDQYLTTSLLQDHSFLWKTTSEASAFARNVSFRQKEVFLVCLHI